MVVVPPATADLVPYLKLSTVYSMEVVPVCTSFEVIRASPLTTKQCRLFEVDMTVYAPWLICYFGQLRQAQLDELCTMT